MNIALLGVTPRGLSLASLAILQGHKVALFDGDVMALTRAQQRLTLSFEQAQSGGKMTAEQVEAARQALLVANRLEDCANADFIFYTKDEPLDQQKVYFEKLDRLAARSTIILGGASPTPLASAAQRFPERVLGAHFHEPYATQTLVEVIPAEQTLKEVLERALFSLRLLGKEPIVVKETAGLVVERLMAAYAGEALRLVGESDVSPEQVDKLLGEVGLNAPFRWMDSIGLDAHLAGLRALYEASFHEPRYRPHPLQVRMVAANRLGRKTRQGFYKYDD